MGLGLFSFTLLLPQSSMPESFLGQWTVSFNRSNGASPSFLDVRAQNFITLRAKTVVYHLQLMKLHSYQSDLSVNDSMCEKRTMQI